LKRFKPDCISCGIYATVFATTIALGDNPCEEKYSKDIKHMRKHFCKIVESNKLLPFPQWLISIVFKNLSLYSLQYWPE